MKTRRKNKSKSVRRIGGMFSRIFSRTTPEQTEQTPEEKGQVIKVIKFIDDFIGSKDKTSIYEYICMNLKVIRKELNQNSGFIKNPVFMNITDFVVDTKDALSLINKYKKYRNDKYENLSKIDREYLFHSFCLGISFSVCETVQKTHSKNKNAEKIESLAINVDKLLFSAENGGILSRGFYSIHKELDKLKLQIDSLERDDNSADKSANAAAKSADKSANAAAKSADKSANAAAKSADKSANAAANAAAKSANAAANAAKSIINGGHRTTRKRRRRSRHNKYNR